MELDIKYIDIGDLKPYKKNAKKHPDSQVEYIANSIKAFGFKQPLVIDKDNVVVIGHGRLMAAKKLGIESVPCVTADDLSEDEIKALRLADNKTNESEWDFDILDDELSDILNLDMSDFGFDISFDDLEENLSNDEPEDDLYDDIEKQEKHYGVPYQGNKSRIADIIISILPEGNRLVDLFGGGGAITHCAILSGKWGGYLYNDINPMITGLFMDAVHGEYHDEHRVITREDFENLKDTDAYVKYIWSFGNNGTGYLWGKDIEDIIISACHAIADETLQDRRLAYMRFVKKIKDKMPKQRLDLHSYESLNRLQSLEHLEALQRLEVSNIDYQSYQYKEGDIVYCDIPYEQQGKAKCDDYGLDFDSLAFYEWVKQQPYQVFFFFL